MTSRRLALPFLAAVFLAATPIPGRAGMSGGPETGGAGPLPPELGLGPEMRWQDIAREAGPKLTGSPLSLAEAIRVGVASSPNLRVAGYDPKIAQAELEARRGVYEPHLFADGSASQNVTPSASPFAGATTLTVRDYSFDAGLRQSVPTGADITLQLSNWIEKTDSSYAGLNPQYTPNLDLTVAQPLLMNLLTDPKRTQIRVGQANLDASVASLGVQVRDIALDIEAKYWDLAFAAENLRVKDVALNLGERLLGNNKLRFEIGVIPETEVIAAAAEVARRRDDLVIARLGYRNAQDDFRRTAGLDQAGPDILPSDALASPAFDRALSGCLDESLRKREEILAAEANIRGLEAETRLARNSLLPELDFVGAVGLNGISGAAQTVEFGGQFIQVPYGGSFARSYDRMFSGDFYSWSAGLRLDFPILWKEASARARAAQANEAKARDDLVRLDSDISLEVRRAFNGADSSFARVATTSESVSLAEQDLAAEVTRYNVGVSQTDDVIRKLNIYALTLTESVRAKADYLKSLAALDRAMGVTIERKGIRFAGVEAQAGP